MKKFDLFIKGNNQEAIQNENNQHYTQNQTNNA